MTKTPVHSIVKLLGVCIFLGCTAILVRPAQASSDESNLAHSILRAALTTNGLARTATPWHLKADIQFLRPAPQPPLRVQLEEWSRGPAQWRRTWSSGEPGLSGTEWSAGPHDRYLSHHGADTLDRIRLNQRIARPLTDPLRQASQLGPDVPLELKIISAGGVTLHCISAVTPDSPAPYPGMCFDRANRLRLLSTLSFAVEFDKYQVFEGRAVPRSLKVLVNGTPFADVDVTALEPLPAADAARLQPQRAIPEPPLLEPGDAAPVSLTEAAMHPPLQPDGYPYRGVIFALLILDKDGRVRIDRGMSLGPSPDVLDSLEIALKSSKFQPYQLDGRPARVAFVATYPLDGKPFQPHFAKPQLITALDFNAYLQAARAGGGFAMGGQRRGGRGRR